MAGKFKVLVSSSLEPFLKLDEEFAAREDFDLHFARDGVSAWEFIRQGKPDLVFLDLHAPGVAGDECCRRARRDPQLRTLPLVLVINSQSKDDLARCLQADCTDILFKPFSNHLLLATARRLLGLTYRSFPRVASRLIVRYGSDRQNLFHGFSFNVSSGGMFIETEDPFPTNQELFLEFSLPNTSHAIVCKAFVAWTNPSAQPSNLDLPPGMGLQFLTLSLPDLLSIWEYFSHLGDNPLSPLPALSGQIPPAG